MTLQELRDGKRDEILLVAAHRGARNVRVFGSVARETTTNAVTSISWSTWNRDERCSTSVAFFDLESLLHAPVDVVTERGLRPRVRERVLAEAVPL